MNHLNVIIPIFDYLYIYQNLEYEYWPFLRWFYKYPFKRNLQKKHSLDLTFKALFLLLIALITIFLVTSILSLLLTQILELKILTLSSILLFGALLFINLNLSPIYLLIAQAIFSPLEAYQKRRVLLSAQNKLKKLPNLKVIAITGSYAKTSTKDILYTLLWKKYQVVKTPKSFNTSLSIAHTILDLVKNNTEVLLVEMDAYHPREIDKLSKLVGPDLGIITGITSQHLERFGTMDKLIKTQFEIAQNLATNGILFLNSTDEETVKSYKNNLPLNVDLKFYGLSSPISQFYATGISKDLTGTSFTFHYKSQQVKVHIPLFGEHHVINFLGAAAIALNLGLSLNEISLRALKLLPTPHRLEIKKQDQMTIIDNSYNTNPISAQTALLLLKDYPGKLKIVITPGLVELGPESYIKNKQFGNQIGQSANKVIIIGDHAKKPIIEGLNEVNFPQKDIYLVKSLDMGFTQLGQIATPETVVLIENDLPDQYF